MHAAVLKSARKSRSRIKQTRKNGRIEEQDSDSEGVLGRTAASSRHYAEVRVLAKDIRKSEELKSPKQKQSQYQKNMDQTLNAKMTDENNEIFKNDTQFHEFRTAVATGADLQHARMAKEVTQSSPRPSGKRVIINEYESDKGQSE